LNPHLVLIFVTLLWGSTFVVTKHLVAEVAPLPFAAVRFGLAAALLLVGTAGRMRRLASRRAIWDGFVLGLMNAAGLGLQLFGQAYTTASKSAFITSLNTPLTPLVAFLVYRQHPTRQRLAAVVVASMGLFLLTYPTGGAAWNRGDLLTIGCAVLYSFTIVEIARRTPRHDAVVLTTMQVVTSAVMFGLLYVGVQAALALAPARVPEVLLIEARGFSPSPLGWIEIAYMATVCTILTFGLQTWSMARMSATAAAIIFALEPVFATAMAVVLWGGAEWPGPRGALGAATVILAALWSELRLPLARRN
jgi:drug/metabolite transporter (DMT)-like permease